jgi:phenylacetate-CoA ligase
MALQARQLVHHLAADGLAVSLFPSNFRLPGALAQVERVPGARTLCRAIAIWFLLVRAARQVDIIHILAASWVYFFIVVYPATVVGRLFRKRVVVNYRGGEAREFFRHYGWLAPPVFRLASAVTAPSKFLAGVIGDRFGVDVAIVPNILDTSIFRYRQRDVFQPKLLVTRHLDAMYDPEGVLSAFRILQNDCPEASLWIAGTGHLEPRLRSLVEEWELKQVRFLGHVPYADLPRIYDQCDIYINASRVDNFPGALLEASAAGLAVVTTGSGGIPALYEHGKTAFLVDAGDYQGLATAVRNVLQFPSQVVEMTLAALAMVRSCEWHEMRGALYRSYGFAPSSSEPVGVRRCVAG